MLHAFSVLIFLGYTLPGVALRATPCGRPYARFGRPLSQRDTRAVVYLGLAAGEHTGSPFPGVTPKDYGSIIVLTVRIPGIRPRRIT